ncbi:hypothetical protein D9M68_844150 [compost metagenome]
MVNGNHCQVSAREMAQSAVSGLAMSERTGQPRCSSARCIGLTSGVYMIFQISATTIGGSTIGMRNSVRAPSSTRDFPLSNSASPRPTSNCNTTLDADSLNCTAMEPRKRLSCSSCR